jgi:ABC-2 type transport system permease protein
MPKVIVVFRRELTQYFTSPTAYLVAFAALILAGLAFNSDLAARNGHSATDGTVVLNSLAFFTLFFAPLLTMRLLAEENREGTIELLMTLPINDGDIVLGKFLGAWAYYTLLLLLTVVYQLILVWLAPPDVGTVISAYIGLWLLGGAALAVGMLFSAITENQIVAGFLSLATLLILWLTGQVGTLITNRDVAVLIRSFSFQAHYLYSFSLGVVRLDDIVFFVGMIGALLFITTRLVESRRWR